MKIFHVHCDAKHTLLLAEYMKMLNSYLKRFCTVMTLDVMQ